MYYVLADLMHICYDKVQMRNFRKTTLFLILRERLILLSSSGLTSFKDEKWLRFEDVASLVSSLPQGSNKLPQYETALITTSMNCDKKKKKKKKQLNTHLIKALVQMRNFRKTTLFLILRERLILSSSGLTSFKGLVWFLCLMAYQPL